MQVVTYKLLLNTLNKCSLDLIYKSKSIVDDITSSKLSIIDFLLKYEAELKEIENKINSLFDFSFNKDNYDFIMKKFNFAKNLIFICNTYSDVEKNIIIKNNNLAFIYLVKVDKEFIDLINNFKNNEILILYDGMLFYVEKYPLMKYDINKSFLYNVLKWHIENKVITLNLNFK